MNNSDSMRVSNRIITVETLNEIFDKMNDKLEQVLKISRKDERRNAMLNYQYQNYTYKDSNSELIFTVYYYDDTSIKYDNYASFMATFRNRLEDIKEITTRLHLSYSVKEQHNQAKYYSHSIRCSFYEHKADMDFSLDSGDKQLEDVYMFIKEKIQSSPIKYDDIIKKKSIIKNVISFAKSFIPAIILCTILLFIGDLRQVVAESYVLFPIGVITLTFVLSNTFFTYSTTRLYENIVPKVEYAGYSKKSGSIYKENIDKYTETSEILIGKNVRNMDNRKMIQEQYNKFKKWIPYELGVLAILSIIVLFFR